MQNARDDPVEIHRLQEQRRRSLAKKRLEEQRQPRTPEPVEGRTSTIINNC
jgi:hypothetical protein